MPRRTLVKGGRLLTMADGVEETAADLLIEGTRIAAIGRGLAVADAETLDATGMIVLPGFVDTHRHVWQTPLRTLAADWSLYDYFTQMRLVYGSFFTAEDAYLGNLAGALEALAAGVTTVVDHCHVINTPEHADEAIRGLDEAGIRAVFCYGLFPSPAHHPFRLPADSGWRLDDARRVRRARLSADDGRIVMGLAPGDWKSATARGTSGIEPSRRR